MRLIKEFAIEESKIVLYTFYALRQDLKVVDIRKMKIWNTKV